MTEIDRAPLEPLLKLLREGAAEGAWLKCVFSHPDPGTGEGPHWEKLTAEPVKLSRGPAVKLVTNERGRQATLTDVAEQWPSRLDEVLARNPRHINLLGRERDWHARLSKGGRWLVSRGKPSLASQRPAGELPPHDREPNHPLQPEDDAVRALFIETGLFGLNGHLRGVAADKYRQVQHYIELLRTLDVWTAEREGGRALRIVDAGCGKAYLSLALYQFARQQSVDAELVGIDQNEVIIANVARSAKNLGYERAEFRAQTIEAFAAEAQGTVDLLVSLHACDTATDEAIAAGVRMGARAIVLAPCCHHEVAEQIEGRLKAEAAAAGGSWDAVLGYGLLRHRLADIVTDGLRAAALEMFGYKVDVAEFVSPEATARNLMIRAELRPDGDARMAAMAKGRAEYVALAGQWDLHPAMERLLGDAWPR